jgi:hypothetical protein
VSTYSLLATDVHIYATSSLLTEPKSRKVIIVEHPLLPVYVKDILAKILFENLQVRPSIVLVTIAHSVLGPLYILCF